ncbi:MAG: hypothetical protein COT33_02855 [Candidatus Nealsonbacteria bacterium CG08_land_8_20_14_0_20_38_20]|uniref:DHHA1 domain-containing protein n=1 Tax=Candidatus Nealsonbacteria bacterium CG08_land_8_20_14_0_20_38_20 TaxID=1974705 RepID=A0A2H0YL94_9BACT|nr:MAG: hypothetical protein COT33_02855 [Candidatus Nealsonbacteria bacterium CG08_land_8_20_14_0_20_38_20]
MKTIGVTHHEFDFDGGSCLRILERRDLIQECIFGEEELKEKLEEGGINKLIFVDASPKESLSDMDLVIYDHHQSKDIDDRNKTAFDILIDKIGIEEFDSEKIKTWRELVWLGDHKSEADKMDIAQALKKVHLLLESDTEVYTRWFTPLFDSFFANKPSLERAIKVFQEEISKFLSNNPDSPAKVHLQRWSERLRDKEKISRSTIRNVAHFLAYMEENVAKEWIRLLLEGYDKEQIEFQEGKADFHKAEVNFYGNTLIISAVTKNPRFKQVATHMIYSKDQDVNPLIRGKIKDRNSPWLVVVINPRNKNFQIFINGNKSLIHRIITEPVKAIRAEILSKRNRPVPDFNILSEGGTIEGTKPLYFHKLETGYPSILWGSLKHPEAPATVFGDTSAEIHSNLIELVKLALDENEWADGCPLTSCKDCPIYPWQLKKCYERRKK